MELSFWTVFGAGVLASLSPCVYPLLPITLGVVGVSIQSRSSQTSTGAPVSRAARVKILSLILGQILAMMVLGWIAVMFGEAFGFTSENRVLRMGVGVFLVMLGLLSFGTWMPTQIARWSGKWNHWSSRMLTPKSQLRDPTGNRNGQTRVPGWIRVRKNFFTPFLVGVSSSLIASPCTGPILGGILALIATEGSTTKGVALMGLYGLGFSFLFLLIGLGATQISRLPRAGQWMNGISKFSSLLLVGAGLWMIWEG